MTEYAGPELAMWELSHGLEWVAATGLVATLVAPHRRTAGGSPRCIFVALSFAIVLLLSVLAAATARLAIDYHACASTGNARSSSRFLPSHPRSS